MSHLYDHRRLSILAALLIVHLIPSLLLAQKPLPVFILAGQSNMQGHAHVDTLKVMAQDPDTEALYHQIVEADGQPKVWQDIWISSLGSADEIKSGPLTVGFGAQAGGPKIGPELTFGIVMHQHLNQPILLIKTAWGGKSLHTDFRPPGSGPYPFSQSQWDNAKKQNKDLESLEQEKQQQTGVYYRAMIEHVQHVLENLPEVYPDYDPQQGYQLAGFVWFQGWNDMVDGSTYQRRGQPGGYDSYSDNLQQLIRDVRKDLKSPALPFVIGVMGVGGPTDQYSDAQKRYQKIHQSFRDAMAGPATLPEFKATVRNVLTEQYWDMKLQQLRDQEEELKQQVRQRKQQESLDKKQEQALLEELRSQTFTAEQQQWMKDSVSNFEFHYLGSAKIMTQIGKGFADAMWEIMQNQ